MTAASAEKRAKKRATLREALRNRGGAPTVGEQSPTAAGDKNVMPLVRYPDVADLANRLGLQSATIPVDRAAIWLALQVRGGVKRRAVIHAQLVPAPVPQEPSTPTFLPADAQGKTETAEGTGEKQADSPKEELQLPDTSVAENGAARENATPEKLGRTAWTRFEGPPYKETVSSRVTHFNRPMVGQSEVSVPWTVTTARSQLRRSVSDLGTDTRTETATVYEGPRNVKDLRNFWGKKASEAGGTNTGSKSEPSMQEVQALLQRILAAGSKTDFDEVRRLRKLLADIE